MEARVIYWLKRDFRLSDNPALWAALEQYKQVVPVFILEDSFLNAEETSAFHLHAIGMAVNELRQKLKAKGGDLLILKGEVIALLTQLYESTTFSAIVAHEEIGTLRTYQRDEEVRDWCSKRSIVFEEHRQTAVFRGLKDRNLRHKKWKAFMTSAPLAVPLAIDRCTVPEVWQEHPAAVPSIGRPGEYGFTWSDAQQAGVQSVSENTGFDTLRSFLYERGIAYRGGISSPLTAFTAGSRLSVHLAWGTLTGRQVYAALGQRQAELLELKEQGDPEAGKWRSSLRAFSSRLHWRDHFIQRLESEPNMELEALNPAYEQLVYDNDLNLLEAWENGQTGFPMVDACIRCMQQTGFVNFRMRAMLTSFACHNLHLSWKLINAPMARLYTDYEPGIHLSQLQMQAGVVGINTLRIYSPDKQIIDQDPEAKFIKQWIPELRSFSAEEIQKHRREPLGDYPGQIIDRLSATKEMRSRVYAIRRTEGYRELANAVYQKHGSRKAGPQQKAARKEKNATSAARSR